MATKLNRQWRLAVRPTGAVKESDFTWREEPLSPIADGQILVRVVYLSLDPTNRVWMNESASYLPAIPLGEVMRGGGIGIVEESKNPEFAEGDIVGGLVGWQQYFLSSGAGLSKYPKGLPIPLKAFLALLGHIGITAYFGLLDVGKPKDGETLVVSAAAGAVGSLVGQIGKIKGCRVVGLAGTDEKCAWLTGELGFDAAINYKNGNILEHLKAACPNGIDIYFDNVGGEILEAALSLINLHARVPLCGMISGYNAAEPSPGPSNLALLIMQRARMEGFLVLDYMSRADEAAKDLITWHLSGKLKYKVDEVDGLEKAPQALNRLFDGSNIGKLIVKVGAE